MNKRKTLQEALEENPFTLRTCDLLKSLKDAEGGYHDFKVYSVFLFSTKNYSGVLYTVGRHFEKGGGRTFLGALYYSDNRDMNPTKLEKRLGSVDVVHGTTSLETFYDVDKLKVKIREKKLGEYHPDVADSLKNLILCN